MRLINVILTASMALLLSVNCDNPESSDDDSCNQIFVVNAEIQYDDWEEEDRFIIYGMVTAEKLPSFNYYEINNVQYEDVDVDYALGYFYFYSPVVISGVINPLNFKGNTSAGSVSGKISLPNEIQAISLSDNSSISLGEPFTVSWFGSNANFYFVDLTYDWIDSENDWHSEYLDTLVAGNTVTFDGSIFIYDGEIYVECIEPVNGPYPKSGCKANMTGEGTGFLYYSGAEYDIGTYITVGWGLGSGLYKPTVRSQMDISRKDRDSKTTILKYLGL